jgi:hypothetical protein
VLVKSKTIGFLYREEFGLADQDKIDFEAPVQSPF